MISLDTMSRYGDPQGWELKIKDKEVRWTGKRIREHRESFDSYRVVGRIRRLFG